MRRLALNPRVLIGAVIIKHILNLDDIETVAQITENMYFQFFLSYSSYFKEPPFDPSLLVDIRKRLGQELVSEMNERIHWFSIERIAKKEQKNINGKKKKRDDSPDGEIKNKGEFIYIATVCRHDIAYPTDLGLLNKAREITEGLIDIIHQKQPLEKKPRTCRETAQKTYLKIDQNKNPSKKTIRKGIKSQLQYPRRYRFTPTSQD